jgi:hypothetical protein
MINRLIASVLSLLMFIQPVLSTPLVQEEGVTAFPVESATWEAAPFTSMIGELSLDVFYMLPGAPAPVAGVLIDKDDFNKIEFISNRQTEWCDDRLEKERKLCDAKLTECQESCRDLNKSLIDKVDALQTLIDTQTKTVTTLETNLFYWKLGASILGVTTLSLGIYTYSQVK